MVKILVYSADYCPYCVRAKNLLSSKGLAFEEVNVDEKDGVRQKLMAETGMRTIPQIFIGDDFIGGFTELAALEASGELDKKVNG